MPQYFWANATKGTDELHYFVVREGDVNDLFVLQGHSDAYFACTVSAADLIAHTSGATFVPAVLGPGEYYPRMWRGQMDASSKEFGTEDIERDAIRFARMLAERLRDIFRYVEPHSVHDKVYSHELRSLLILACTEVENSCKAILTKNLAVATHRPKPGTPPPSTPKAEYDMYDYSRLADAMRLREWAVSLTTRRSYGPFAPFDNWTLGHTLKWYWAYNKTKHDRDLSLKEATLGRVIQATAAVLVLNMAQFGNHYRDISTYFSPNEFAIEALPQWTRPEQYLTPIIRIRGAGPLPTISTNPAWTPVLYPFTP